MPVQQGCLCEKDELFTQRRTRHTRHRGRASTQYPTKPTVANLTPPLHPPNAPRLSHARRREAVRQHKPLQGIVLSQTVEPLCIRRAACENSVRTLVNACEDIGQCM